MLKNCTVFGPQYLDKLQGRSGKIWNGAFAAICSALCTMLMGLDIYTSLYNSKKAWIGCKYFSLNAMTIAILGYATWISVDIREPMPGFFDQLVKVTGVLFIIFSMHHAMPSVGSMNVKEIISTLVGLGSLVFATMYSIWVQIGNHLVLSYVPELKIYIIFMAFIYVLLVAHALTVPTTKRLLEALYNFKHNEILREVMGSQNGVTDRPVLTKEHLRIYVTKYWLMALTSSPDYVLRASGMSQTTALLCILLFSNFITVLSITNDFHRSYCYTKSNYGGSVIVVCAIQLIAICLGFVTSWKRNEKSQTSDDIFSISFFVEENTWQVIKDWMKYPIPFEKRAFKRLAYYAKCFSIGLLGILQILVIVFCKLYIICLFLLGLPFLIIKNLSDVLRGTRSFSGSSSRQEAASNPNVKELSKFVLGFDSVAGTKEYTVRKWKDEPNKWYDEGTGNPPSKLSDLLQVAVSISARASDIRRLFLTTSRITSSDEERHGDCRSLRLMTVACIINNGFPLAEHEEQLKNLNERVEDGFLYFSIIDKTVNKPRTITLDTAKLLLERFKYQRKWLGVKLNALQDSDSVLKRIEQIKAESDKTLEGFESKKTDPCSDHDGIAATIMSSITEAMLTSNVEWTPDPFNDMRDALVHWMYCSLAMKLPSAIFKLCSHGKIGKREEKVRLAAKLLGQTEEMLCKLHRRLRENMNAESSSSTTEVPEFFFPDN